MNVLVPDQQTLPAANDWRLCEEIARDNGRSFYLASRCLPTDRRRAIRATYAWCRLTDDIVDSDDHRDHSARAEALDRWETQLTEPVDVVARTFAHVRETYSIPLKPMKDLIAGARMDLTAMPYRTWEDLRVYCYHVAGTVGLMVAPILGCTNPDALVHAADLGIAMQMTNILRDVAEDAAMGRLYLPLDELEAFSCTPEAIMAGRPEPGFRDFMAFQIDRTRKTYVDALQGVSSLSPTGQFATLAASRFYAGILDEIETMDYDVFRQRAYVPSSRKIRSIPGIALSVVGMSLFGNVQTAYD